MQFDREKLKNVILYTCSKCAPSELGAVKLHKVLYYTDMVYYVDVGAPLTGSTYRKRPFGPTCDQLLSTLHDMEGDASLRVSDVEYFGYKKKEYEALREPEAGRLSQAATDLLDEVIDFVCRDNTAKTISEFSHSRAWEIAEFGEELPYYSAVHLYPTQVSREAFDWAEGEAAAIASQRSKQDPMDYPLFADLRKRVLQEDRSKR